MQMQKKITVKDDGRFLTYYHFPATASADETEVFNGIVPTDAKEEPKSAGAEEKQQNGGVTENAGGVPHV